MKSDIALPDSGRAQALKIIFTHAGVERTLAKHADVYAQLKKNLITEAEARFRPWYIRISTGGKQRPFKLKAIKEEEAIREAKDLLKGQVNRANDFQEFIKAKDASQSVTIGQLAAEWFAAGLPFSRTRVRSASAAKEVRTCATRALNWWSDHPVASVTPDLHDKFVAWRRQHNRLARIAARANSDAPVSGSRAADKELAALSCLCQWAIKTGRIKINPFAERERFTDPETVSHCHHAMPDNDEQFHRVLAAFFTPAPVPTKPPSHTAALTAAEATVRREAADQQRVVVGAWLAFSAMTGLRPGEHQFLQRVPAAKTFPNDLLNATCGLVYPMPDGTKRMKVQRTKHGQNPAVVIHTALQDFLDHYLPWLAAHFPDSLALFPGIDGEWQIGGYLRRVCATAKVKKMKPHGFGRAYYVRVRRSQGIDDATISAELGQKSDGTLIRSVYGDPKDPVGGNLHDWLPANGVRAWHALNETVLSNIIAL